MQIINYISDQSFTGGHVNTVTPKEVSGTELYQAIGSSDMCCFRK